MEGLSSLERPSVLNIAPPLSINDCASPTSLAESSYTLGGAEKPLKDQHIPKWNSHTNIL